MTQQNLSRGTKINEEIGLLRTALSQVNKSRLFDMDDVGCYVHYADPFLSELNAKVRILAVKEINVRIAKLEKEFAAL